MNLLRRLELRILDALYGPEPSFDRPRRDLASALDPYLAADRRTWRGIHDPRVGGVPPFAARPGSSPSP